jgi:GntR family transcriptional regulator/MocR family aminotransferase
MAPGSTTIGFKTSFVLAIVLILLKEPDKLRLLCKRWYHLETEMLIQLDETKVLYRQIYEAIKGRILGGALPTNSKMPSSRLLADRLGVSRNIVLLAYDQLMAEGYLVSRPGAGTFVGILPEDFLATTTPSIANAGASSPAVTLSDYSKRLGTRIQEPPFRFGLPRPRAKYDFRHGHPPIDLLPQKIWHRLVSHRAARFGRDDVAYAPPQGDPELRESMSRYLSTYRGVISAPGRVVIVNGSQQALDLLARILINPGDSVVLEEPCYPGTRQAIAGLGARIRSVEVDEHGLNTDKLNDIEGPVKLICVTPSHQYPTGAIMPLHRRLALIAYAKRVGAFILEDDYDSEFRYDARPEKAVQGLDASDQVVYVGTFSKLLFPALRLGYVVLPEALVEPFAVAKSVSDRCSAPFMQGVISDFISEGHFERHLRRLRVEVSARRQYFIDLLRANFGDGVRVAGSNAGVYLLAWFDRLATDALADAIADAAKLGVAVYAVDPCFTNSRPPGAGLVMGYASMCPKDCAEGLRRLHRAFQPFLEQKKMALQPAG